ncbi:uncharacterized protein GLRG_09316 [Colletotrichum graminicola M1.001]|uniref:Uncharacterized protein n=1 Tax=Colletotrichum graminicola (strain M1.001 / M2 / FGSC 10212) TaxID=645133 RepID=E3QTI4_COLGM|nr:uncharacterized protein GLRG_09316 [Colletotrichum graminicola M1.001]EFQ34172.1 hypothetical protein GLRG_09316 [Colletotrichum graminicola M1.001]
MDLESVWPRLARESLRGSGITPCYSHRQTEINTLSQSRDDALMMGMGESGLASSGGVDDVDSKMEAPTRPT